LPLQLAINVVAEEPLGSKESNYILPVSGRSRAGVARFDVALDLWHALRRNLVPDHSSGAPVEAVDMPGVLGQVGVRSHIAEQAMPEIFVALTADSGSDEDPVTPYDGARVSQSRDGRFPDDVCAFGGIPVCWRRFAVGHARSVK